MLKEMIKEASELLSLVFRDFFWVFDYKSTLKPAEVHSNPEATEADNNREYIPCISFGRIRTSVLDISHDSLTVSLSICNSHL